MLVRLLSCLFLILYGLNLTSYSQLRADDKPTAKATQPEPQMDAWAKPWWMPRHEAKLKEKLDHTKSQMIWIGDSITHGWENDGKEVWTSRYAPRKSFNIGYSGDRTEQVLWRLQQGEIDGIDSKLVVIMIGTNNTGHRQDPASETASGVEEIVKLVRSKQPNAKILLLAIFPRGKSSDDRLRKLNAEINEKISKLADNKTVFFEDIGAKFVDSDGNIRLELMPDALHPNKAGYEIWADAIEPKVAELLGEKSK